MRNRLTGTCSDCGTACEPRAKRCRPCRKQYRLDQSALKHVCASCGGFKYRAEAQRCGRCYMTESRVRRGCIDCGGRKSSSSNIRCGGCYAVALNREADDANGVLLGFSGAAFRALRTSADLDWPIDRLARVADVSQRSIYAWESDARKPRRVEWERVAAVLAMSPCQHCHGSGMVDPTQQRVTAITESVQRRLRVLPAAQPVIDGAGWTLDPNTLQLTIGAVTVRLTRQEAALVATVAQAERFVPTTALEPAARTHLSRLRAKCNAVGTDLGNVIETVIGAGYRARLARDVEATG